MILYVALLASLVVSAYLTLVYLAPALAALTPNLGAIGKFASTLSILNPIFTMLILVFAFHDKIAKRATQVSECNRNTSTY
jgi:hypothetical protein